MDTWASIPDESWGAAGDFVPDKSWGAADDSVPPTGGGDDELASPGEPHQEEERKPRLRKKDIEQ